MSDIAPRQLILTLYGLYARDERNWLSVNAVVRMMGDLGVDSAGVRSSVSRLKRRGVLESMKVGSRAGYALSEQTLELLREGDVRIFGRQRATESDGLVLAVFSVPESERDRRHTLRSVLSAMGFGTASPGVWVAPGVVHDEAFRMLERRGLSPYVDLFRARYDGFETLEERIAQWWDLDAIDAEYSDFVERFADTPSRWKASTDAPRSAFEVYVPMLTQWRRLPYLDPGLPLSVLPKDWSGGRANDLFADLDALLRTSAREHALGTIHA